MYGMGIDASHRLREVLRDCLADNPPTLPRAEVQALVDSALDHHVGGFLYSRLALKGAHGSSDHFGRLEADYRVNQLQYFQYISSLTPVCRELFARKIPFFAYKGLPLIDRLYGNPGERTMTDVDLVLHPHDVPTVHTLFQRHGFIPWEGVPHRLSRGELSVDLHQDVFRLDRIPSRASFVDAEWHNKIWKRLIPYEVHGCPLAALHPYDEFALLSWHALKHSFSHLKWTIDLALLFPPIARSPEFSRYLVALPHDSIRKSVGYTLWLLRDWFAHLVQDTLISSLVGNRTNWIERRQFQRILLGADVRYFAEWSFLGTMTNGRTQLAFVRDMIRGHVASFSRAL